MKSQPARSLPVRDRFGKPDIHFSGSRLCPLSIRMRRTRKGRRRLSPPLKPAIAGVMPIALRRPYSNPRTIKLRLTLFLPPNHGFGESFCGHGRRRPHHFFYHTLFRNRPESSPKPSIRASVPSTDSSRALTSLSHAMLASVGSSPNASSASFFSLSRACVF